MIIKNARFVTGFAAVDKYTEYASDCSLPEICVAGRSNVGKSTFINMLAGQSKLARTSSTPGRTRLINIFDFNNGMFRLADLPGYGYALASKSDREDWGALMEGYLQYSPNLRHTLLLVDSRHLPTRQDEEMTEYLYYYRMPFTVVATKCDKLKKSALSRNISDIASALKIGRDNIIAVDASGTGRDSVLNKIESILSY